MFSSALHNNCRTIICTSICDDDLESVKLFFCFSRKIIRFMFVTWIGQSATANSVTGYSWEEKKNKINEDENAFGWNENPLISRQFGNYNEKKNQSKLIDFIKRTNKHNRTNSVRAENYFAYCGEYTRIVKNVHPLSGRVWSNESAVACKQATMSLPTNSLK